MIRATGTTPHARHVETKQNTHTQKPEPIELSELPDIVYILDLSGLNEQNDILGQHADQFDLSALLPDWSDEAQSKLWDIRALDERNTQEVGDKGDNGLRDETLRLTRMLVAARSTITVQGVLSEAYKNMQEWQKAAVTGDKKAAAVVRKLNKLIARGNRKVRDLHKEQKMLIKQKRAEKAKKEQLANRLREELKQVELRRRTRERRYLQDRDLYKDEENSKQEPSAAATEAKIMALAQAMAAASSGTGGAEGDFGSGDVGVGDGSSESDGGGGEAAVAGGEAGEDF